jgi:phosphate butyryltransferase
VAVIDAADDAASPPSEGVRAGIADAILIGDEKMIREKMGLLGEDELGRRARIVGAAGPEEAAAAGVEMARRGEAAILLKGHLRTDQLLKAVLDKEHGLRTGRVLSDVLIYEDTTSGERRLVGVPTAASTSR